MFIGFTFSSLELCITIAALYSTATMLFGGFYANTIPVWLNWLRYGSIVYFGYLNMQMVEFGTGPAISCAIKNSKFPSCIISSTGGNSSTTGSSQLQLPQSSSSSSSSLSSSSSVLAGIVYIPDEEILVGLDPMKPNEVPNPIWFNTLCLIGFFLFFRILGYMALRIYHKPS